MVSDESLPEFVHTAAISGTLPDIILHPSEFSSGWVQEGILDRAAATEVIVFLSPETFENSALRQVMVDPDEPFYSAIPSHLWRLLIIYREDWFEERALERPDSFETILSAAEAIYEPEQNRYGLVVPTDAALASTQRLFEFLALANGCQLVNQEGEVTILHPACLETLEYYRAIINQFSPIGTQTEISAINAYLAGRTGLIIASSDVLPAIAGMEDDFRPSCLACTSSHYLADNSNFIFDITGTGEFSSTSSLSGITALGITAEANRDSAKSFANYWFDSGYTKWLSVNPERKIPLRLGRHGEPQFFLDEWKNMPSRTGQPALKDLFGEEFANSLAAGTGNDSRWATDLGQGELLTSLYEELVLSPLLQEMLSGYFSSSQSIIEIYRAVVAQIPGYAFPLPAEPEATPTP